MKTISMEPMTLPESATTIEMLTDPVDASRRGGWTPPSKEDLQGLPWRYKGLLQKVLHDMATGSRLCSDDEYAAAQFVCAVATEASPTECFCMLSRIHRPGEAVYRAMQSLRRVYMKTRSATHAWTDEHSDERMYTSTPSKEHACLWPQVHEVYALESSGWYHVSHYTLKQAAGNFHELPYIETCCWPAMGISQMSISVPRTTCECWTFDKCRPDFEVWGDQRGASVKYPADFHEGQSVHQRFAGVTYFSNMNICVSRNEDSNLTFRDLVYYRHYKEYQQRQWFQAAMSRLERHFFYTLKERMEKRLGKHLPGGALHDAAVDELQAPNGPAAKVARVQ